MLVVRNDSLWCLPRGGTPQPPSVVAPPTAPGACIAVLDCSSLTTDLEFVTCLNGQCVCRYDRGFEGNATLNTLCSCPLDKTLELRQGLLFCIPRSTIPPQPPVSQLPPASQLPNGTCLVDLDCVQFTEELEFITCFENRCVCRTDRGFEGSVSQNLTCTCPSDKMLAIRNNITFCIPRPPQPPTSAPVPISAPVQQGRQCSQQWQCSSLTLNFNYIACINGTCLCRESQGFSRLNITGNPCGCEAPKTVVWTNGIALCLDIPLIAPILSSQVEFFPCEANWQCQERATLFHAVNCNANRCVCQSQRGFSGLGTIASPCTCVAPRQVFWQNNTAYCIDFTPFLINVPPVL